MSWELVGIVTALLVGYVFGQAAMFMKLSKVMSSSARMIRMALKANNHQLVIRMLDAFEKNYKLKGNPWSDK